MREMALIGRVATVLPATSVSQEIDEGRLVSRPLIGLDIEDAPLELVTRFGAGNCPPPRCWPCPPSSNR